MTGILLAIKPQFVAKILSGEKRFEFRKCIPSQIVDKILIYSSYPEYRIIGEAKVKCVLSGLPCDIWVRTQKWSGVSKGFFFEYYKGKDIAYAYELSDIKKYVPLKRLEDFKVSRAPQSFMYIQ